MAMKCSCFKVYSDNTNSEARKRFAKACQLVIEKGRNIMFHMVMSRKTESQIRSLLKERNWEGKVGIHITNCILGREQEIQDPRQFDVTTLYTIIRHGNVLNEGDGPTNGWGVEVFKQYTRDGDDVERIRQRRNYLSHITVAALDEDEFDEISKEMEAIANRRNLHDVAQEMEEIKDSHMSASEVQSIISKFVEDASRARESGDDDVAKSDISDMKRVGVELENECLKEYVQNIIEEYDAYLEETSTDDDSNLQEQLERTVLSKEMATSRDIHIRVLTLDRRTIPIKTRPSALVKSIKQKIEIVESIPKERQRLTFKGKELADDKCLEVYGITDDSRINLLLQLGRSGRDTSNKEGASMKITITTVDGRKLTLAVHHIMYIKSIKQKIRVLDGTPVGKQRLTHKGRELDDFKTLGDYGIEDGATLHMLLRLGGN